MSFVDYLYTPNRSGRCSEPPIDPDPYYDEEAYKLKVVLRDVVLELRDSLYNSEKEFNQERFEDCLYEACYLLGLGFPEHSMKRIIY